MCSNSVETQQKENLSFLSFWLSTHRINKRGLPGLDDTPNATPSRAGNIKG
jgi:hypothetical protein